MFNYFLIFIENYPFEPPYIKPLTLIKHFCVYESGNFKLAKVNTDWSPANKIKDILESLQYILSTTTEKRLKSDLQDLRNEALVNDTIRNILVNEENLFEWKFSIFPADVPFNVASFGLSIKFPGILF
jgi:ubiquitin-protein ligase